MSGTRFLRGLWFAAALIAISARPASADLVQWTLTGATFEDGTTLTGSFVYDTIAHDYSSIDIVTAGGSVAPAEAWTFENTNFAANANFLFLLDSSAANLTGTHLIRLGFLSPLAPAGGTLSLNASGAFSGDFEGTCGNAKCGGGDTHDTYLAGGSVVGTVLTPEPAEMGPLVLAAALLAGAAFRRAKAHDRIPNRLV
jgi:hypothetical protein